MRGMWRPSPAQGWTPPGTVFPDGLHTHWQSCWSCTPSTPLSTTPACMWPKQKEPDLWWPWRAWPFLTSGDTVHLPLPSPCWNAHVECKGDGATGGQARASLFISEGRGFAVCRAVSTSQEPAQALGEIGQKHKLAISGSRVGGSRRVSLLRVLREPPSLCPLQATSFGGGDVMCPPYPNPSSEGALREPGADPGGCILVCFNPPRPLASREGSGPSTPPA